ncbi:AP-1 complex subunit beta-1 [Neofusicoccum parvum]|uniref:AP-1 complex subunit beta-1 n=1 Tax=Neofusicoccum parvum TaxID=310453 RepID=A0ACB5RRI1_9PEZI|nr:AP-1 complex subunit beta-1 [Neofusicoccum parvum]
MNVFSSSPVLSVQLQEYATAEPTTTTTTTPQPFRFLSFPKDVRSEIYNAALVGHDSRRRNYIRIATLEPATIGPRAPPRVARRKKPGAAPLAAALLRTSREVHGEAAPHLYRENVFAFRDAAALGRFRRAIGAANARWLRAVAFSNLGGLAGFAERARCAADPRLLAGCDDARAAAFAGMGGLDRVELRWVPWGNDLTPDLAAHCLFFCARGWVDAVGRETGDVFAAVERVFVQPTAELVGTGFLGEMKLCLRRLMESTGGGHTAAVDEEIDEVCDESDCDAEGSMIYIYMRPDLE